MSSNKDAQALFRAAKAQRAATTKLTKEQIRALKATKPAPINFDGDIFAQPPAKAPKLVPQSSPAQQRFAPPSTSDHLKHPTPAAPSGDLGLPGGLLADYGSSDDEGNDEEGNAQQQPPSSHGAPASQIPSGSSAAHHPAHNGGGSSGAAAGALPQDFFQHAPAAAGGVPVSASAGQSTAAAAAFDQFMSDMQVELKEQEVAEEDDRQQAAEDDATRAQVEQLLLLQRVEELKEAAQQRNAGSLTLAPEVGGRVAELGAAAKRKVAILQKLEGSDSSSGEDEEDDLDWRAKRL